MAYQISKDNLDLIESLLNNLIVGYFMEGKMMHEQAYANAVIAHAYISKAMGEELYLDIVEEHEANDGKRFIIYPEDEVLDKAIKDLETLKSIMDGKQKIRDTLTSIEDEGDTAYENKQRPHLRLVWSKQ